MIDILLQKAGDKIGREMKTRGDCELLSFAIYEMLDIDLSYNTIRRLYGLVPAVKPSINTLNTIAQFCHYKSFIHFTLTYAHQTERNISKSIYEVIYNCNETETIAFVKSVKSSSVNFIDFLIKLTRELIYNKQFHTLNQLYELKELNYNNYSYSEMLELGNSVGLLLRKVKINNTLLLLNDNFLRCIYLTFVDYSNLNGYYGAWAELLATKKRSPEIKTFTLAILEFKKFLNNRDIQDKFGDLAFSKELHPILCSRLISVKILANDRNQTKSILNKYFKVHSEKKVSTISYSYELLYLAIVTNNRILMMHLIQNIDPNPLLHYQKYHTNSFYLMCMFYYKGIGDHRKAKEFSSLFDLNYVRQSYRDFILLLHSVYLFADTSSSDQKATIKIKYNRLSKKMEYPYFSSSFLKEYFKR